MGERTLLKPCSTPMETSSSNTKPSRIPPRAGIVPPRVSKTLQVWMGWFSGIAVNARPPAALPCSSPSRAPAPGSARTRSTWASLPLRWTWMISASPSPTPATSARTPTTCWSRPPHSVGAGTRNFSIKRLACPSRIRTRTAALIRACLGRAPVRKSSYGLARRPGLRWART